MLISSLLISKLMCDVGLVVSLLAYLYDYPSLNPSDVKIARLGIYCIESIFKSEVEICQITFRRSSLF